MEEDPFGGPDEYALLEEPKLPTDGYEPPQWIEVAVWICLIIGFITQDTAPAVFGVALVASTFSGRCKTWAAVRRWFSLAILLHVVAIGWALVTALLDEERFCTSVPRSSNCLRNLGIDIGTILSAGVSLVLHYRHWAELPH